MLHGRFASIETLFEARYHDIIENERIAYVYDMHLSGRHHSLSLSLATVELLPEDSGTTSIFTEQVAFFDGTDAEEGTFSRMRETNAHFD